VADTSATANDSNPPPPPLTPLGLIVRSQDPATMQHRPDVGPGSLGEVVTTLTNLARRRSSRTMVPQQCSSRQQSVFRLGPSVSSTSGERVRRMIVHTRTPTACRSPAATSIALWPVPSYAEGDTWTNYGDYCSRHVTGASNRSPNGRLSDRHCTAAPHHAISPRSKRRARRVSSMTDASTRRLASHYIGLARDGTKRRRVADERRARVRRSQEWNAFRACGRRARSSTTNGFSTGHHCQRQRASRRSPDNSAPRGAALRILAESTLHAVRKIGGRRPPMRSSVTRLRPDETRSTQTQPAEC